MIEVGDSQENWTPACSIEDVIANRPKIHHDTGTYGIGPAVITELQRRLKPGMKTMETGSGISTFVFALSGAYHTVITPDASEFVRMREFCGQLGIPLDRLTMVPESSHTALPKQPTDAFDVIFVDGCHGIPMVQVDYLFSALALKVGGTLMLDDVYLSPVTDLIDFLKQEPSWRFDGNFGKTGFFTKMKSGEEIREWDSQPYVSSKTMRHPNNWPIRHHIDRAGRGFKMILKGDLKSFFSKIFR